MHFIDLSTKIYTIFSEIYLFYRLIYKISGATLKNIEP